MATWVLAVVLVWGVNLIFWGGVGLIRIVTDRLHRRGQPDPQGPLSRVLGVRKDEVAVVVPAHNEELVIAETIKALLPLLPAERIFVVSDGSKDRTVAIASGYGVNVLDLNPSHGKAGALDRCMRHFELLDRFKAVVLVDADTRLKEDYLLHALPFFNDPRVAAVAGYASTIWDPERLSWKQKLFVLHRERVYLFSQMLIKFGQTWRHSNVSHIVPGFASIYRTSALKNITMNPPGLVIEDFNMTMEIHHKGLGIIAHHPSVVAHTQDPDTLNDYYRQVRRWHLGFWQTLRFHGFWPGRFWAAMSVMLLEVVSSGLFFLLLPLIALFFYLPVLPIVGGVQAYLQAHLVSSWLFWGVWLPDYALTVAAAIHQRRPQYLVVGIMFPFIRFYDALAFVGAIPRAFFSNSNGRWVSPSRRAI